jgi:hypothetical protein
LLIGEVFLQCSPFHGIETMDKVSVPVNLTFDGRVLRRLVPLLLTFLGEKGKLIG